MLTPEIIRNLQCPDTRNPLSLHPMQEAAGLLSTTELVPLLTRGSIFSRCHDIETVLVDSAGCRAYLVINGIPVLLSTEKLLPAGSARIDPSSLESKYREAYDEMSHYNFRASTSTVKMQETDIFINLAGISSSVQHLGTFPSPPEVWLDAPYDCIAQWEAYNHLGPVQGKRVLQLGGSGSHAVKFLLAGAKEAWLISPMLGELEFGRTLASSFGVSQRFVPVAAVAEELPIQSETFDIIYSGGCMHHTITEISFAECNRVLKKGGRFAATDPWQAPFYNIGTKIFGKREQEVHCRPLTMDRIKPLFSAFGKASVSQHGAITRYFLLALSKLGLTIKLKTAWRIFNLDNRVSGLLGIRRFGSSIALFGERQ